MNIKKILNEIIRNEDVFALCKFFFNVEITQGQEQIIRNIIFPTKKRVVISAYTRYGKSYAVSMAVCIYILLNEKKRINLIAPTGDQTQILRNYITGFIIEHEMLRSMVDLALSMDTDRLKKEVSKKRITFKNGCELRVLSAQGSGDRLMGWGGDLIVLDESCLVNPEVYRTKISRMLGDNKDTMIVEIGNPFTKDSHMYEHWIAPDWNQIHIGWEQGIKEDRLERVFLEEQRQMLTPTEFKVLYEADFPSDSEDTLIRYEWIEQSQKNNFEMTKPKYIAGLDVAEMGVDLTVLTICKVQDNKYEVVEVISWKKQDTMTTVNKVAGKIDKNMLINIDSTGVGKGVFDRLKELGYNAKEIKVGRAATVEKDRFINQKSQYFWSLRSAFEQNRISIPKERNLITELNYMRYEINSSGKIRIIDPSKSPDYADSLMLCFAKPETFQHLHTILDLV
jgi:hypothetical protein